MADPGFPRGGGANSQGGAPGYEFIKISRKLHEIKENSAPRGGGGASPAPPLRSATENILNKDTNLEFYVMTRHRIHFPGNEGEGRSEHSDFCSKYYTLKIRHSGH